MRTMLATGALINRILPPAFFRDQTTMAWLALEATRIWAEHGPGRTLRGSGQPRPLCHDGAAG